MLSRAKDNIFGRLCVGTITEIDGAEALGMIHHNALFSWTLLAFKPGSASLFLLAVA
jgi:hypothetical protein